jgi:hypothetical protein
MNKIEMQKKLVALRAAQNKIAQSRQKLRAQIDQRKKEDDKLLAISIGFAMVAHRNRPPIRAGLDAVVAGALLKPELMGILKELLGDPDAGQPAEVSNPSQAKE